jgi:uncharacterized protein (TIGR03083 family)
VTKQELVERIETEWARLQAALDGLTEEQMHTPGVVGEWSIKDLLAHITAWQSRLITAMFKAEKGFTPGTTEGGATVDQLNEQWYREMKDRPFEQVWDDFDSSYHQLLTRLDSWSDEMLFNAKKFKWMKGDPFERYVAGDSYEHYAEHAAHIEEWRKKMVA